MTEQMRGEMQRPIEADRPATQNLQAAAARAATALRRILTSEPNPVDSNDANRPSQDPVEFTRTAQRKSHFCVLLKPQIALQTEDGEDAVIYIAAMEASLKSLKLLDLDHIDDPVNGYIMRRWGSCQSGLGNLLILRLLRHDVQLHGVQAFVPSVRIIRAGLPSAGIPLEILVDYRGESSDYERLVPFTDAELQYDKFNRLRLHSQVSNVSGELANVSPSSEHMKYQTVGLECLPSLALMLTNIAGPRDDQHASIHRDCQVPGLQVP